MSALADNDTTVPDVPGFTAMNIKIGERLRLLRTCAGLNHQQLVDRAKPLTPATGTPLGRVHLLRVELGRRALKFWEASVLCEALGVDLTALRSDLLAASAAESLTESTKGTR